MTPAEFAAFDTLPPAASASVVGVDSLVDKTARTLLFGYTCERHTWHVYLDAQGTIHRVVYSESRGTPLLLESGAGPTAGCAVESEYVPNKRLYMESCDREFCALLHQVGVSLPFTNYDPQNHAKRETAHGGFTGRIREEFDDLEAKFVFHDLAHPDIATGALARRCTLQALLELRLPYAEGDTGIYVQAHLVPALNDKLEEFVAGFRAVGAPPVSTLDEVMEELRWLAGTLGSYHGDAVLASDTSMPAGTVNSRLNLFSTLTVDSFNRHTGAGEGTVEILGAGAFRVRREKDNLDFVVMPHWSEAHAYSLYLRQFGSLAFFESQYAGALQYLKNKATEDEAVPA